MKVEHTNALRYILQDELYLLDEDKNLYNETKASAPEIKTPLPSFNYLGSNKKNFLILANYADQEFVQDDHLAALEKVLSGIKHTRDDVAILNLAKNDGAAYAQIAAFFNPQTVVILGKQALPEGLTGLDFNTIATTDGAKALLTFSFEQMMTNIDNKKAFWEQIKNL
ncbi:hypothetical protein [Mucilaginibacter ginsenosidivorans]|uniref:Uncharacterized protein n=1 Tax=Mucilaginibacter ginsenosidivorans TaxID=398053 RepID=A0A5B8UTI3_9SPHI|nr:hypothetical protein [Mucilaginibacter ginsenosidivorans]QEC62253.1 hypothetical protein FRZ54_06545 [Mucilaginibacter ginsenosidivorans]